MDIYAHMLPSQERLAADQMDMVFGRLAQRHREGCGCGICGLVLDENNQGYQPRVSREDGVLNFNTAIRD